MSGKEMSPGGRDLLDLLRFDPSKGAPPGAQGRVLDRLGQTVGAMAAASSGPPSHTRLPVKSRVNLARPGGLAAMAARPAWIAAAAFAVGGATGATLHAALQSRAPERIVYVDRVVEGPASKAPLPSQSVRAAPPAPPPEARGASGLAAAPGVAPAAVTGANTAAPVAPVAALAASTAPRMRGLAAERALLDQARKALAMGIHSDADRALIKHTRRFPAGQLVEERDALAIKLLVATGKASEAQRRAAIFRDRFPKSIFGPAVDEALEEEAP